MRVLLVEDEKYIAEFIEQLLKKNHYSVDLSFDGETGLDCALSDIYDIIILDIMLPKMDSIMVLRELRKIGVKTPVLMLTAKGQTEDKVQGLDSGADDYLPKPFDTDELLARLRALGRRNTELSNDGMLIFGNIVLNPHTLMLGCKDKSIRLTLKEAQLLEMLIRRKNMTVSKEIIIEKLWGYDTEAIDNHVEYHVSFLRKKLLGLSSDVSIITIHGAGYTLKEKQDK